MWAHKFLPLMAMFHWTVGNIDPIPACAIHCWENTKYVSKCSDDIECQCNELYYQNSVYQCIYSQCDTAHFGSALHYTITQCIPFNAGKHNEFIFAVPPSHRDDLRRREAEVAAGLKIDGSGVAYKYPTDSVNNSPTQNAQNYPTQSVNSYPTQSVNYYRRSAAGAMDSPSPTPVASPVVDTTLESPTPSPTSTSANTNFLTTVKSVLAEATVAAIAEAQSAVSASATMPVLYTSQAVSLQLFYALPILSTVAAIYLFV